MKAARRCPRAGCKYVLETGATCPLHPPVGTAGLGRAFQDGPAAIVRARSGGVCERAGCTRPARYVDHKRPRAVAGAEIPDASELEHLCAPCHGRKTWEENNP